jgi:hypothetical protein
MTILDRSCCARTGLHTVVSQRYGGVGVGDSEDPQPVLDCISEGAAWALG